jgi:hypothetical protein
MTWNKGHRHRNAAEASSLSKSTFSLLIHLRDCFISTQANTLASHDQVVARPPPKYMHLLHKDLLSTGMTCTT